MDAHDHIQPHFNFDNSFARSLEGFYVSCEAKSAVAPKLLKFNHELAEELGLDPITFDSDGGLAIFSGNVAPEGSEPLAQVYAGHQFGGFTPQLGDGRAILLGEVIDCQRRRRDIQLKGSGRTPFSRGGDGKAPLGPVLREYMVGESMHSLGVPTTRALAAVATGEVIHRETPLPGAVLTRVAASHIRVGTFQFFAARGDFDKVRELADYAIARHYPEAADTENRYLAFFDSVGKSQAALVSRWMSIGFIHGVMNTDNMAISGETIDYGPCAFMDSYAPGTVFSSIDTHGRYAYANQPWILLWNMARLGETLIPQIHSNKERAIGVLNEALERLQRHYETSWLAAMRTKIGLSIEADDDLELVNELLSVMEAGEADFTLVFRRLSQALRGDFTNARQLFNDPGAFDSWIQRWHDRLAREEKTTEATAQSMDRVNPIYIPRNHKVEEAISSAVDTEDMGLFNNLLAVLSRPFDEVVGNEAYAEPAPFAAIPYKTFCGT